MSVKAKIGTACTAGTAACAVGIVVEGLRFNPNGDTTPMTVVVTLFWAGLTLIVPPVVFTVAWFFRELRRELIQAGLTPAQAALAQMAAMTAVDVLWAEANHRESERLTESVMGPERHWR